MRKLVAVMFFDSHSTKDLSNDVSKYVKKNHKDGEICDVDYKVTPYINENNESCVLYSAIVKRYTEV